MMVSRCWPLYECFRVLRTEALGSTVAQRNWALASMWMATLLALAMDSGLQTFIHLREDTCQSLESSADPREKYTMAALCAQSADNQWLASIIHFSNAGLLLASTVLLTVDTVQQTKELKEFQLQMTSKLLNSPTSDDKKE